MYSIIGLLNRPDGQTVEEWRSWWTEQHVPKVLALPGVVDYVRWPVDEEFNVDHSFSEPSYDGVAIITFESKEACLSAFETPEGVADRASVRQNAPGRVVLCGQPFVEKAGLR